MGNTTHTTSSPLTRRAASTAQSTRLLLRSDLVCVLWSVRGLGSGCSSRCWVVGLHIIFTVPRSHPQTCLNTCCRPAEGRPQGRARLGAAHRAALPPSPLCEMRGHFENELRGSIFAHFFWRVRDRCTFPAAPLPSAASPGSPAPPAGKSHHLPSTGSYIVGFLEPRGVTNAHRAKDTETHPLGSLR